MFVTYVSTDLCSDSCVHTLWAPDHVLVCLKVMSQQFWSPLSNETTPGRWHTRGSKLGQAESILDGAIRGREKPEAARRWRA